nr:serine hydrolase [uncultured Butyrivibrio sp.]
MMILKKLSKNAICLTLILVMALWTVLPVKVKAADKCMAENLSLIVNGSDRFNVKAVNPSYDNNTYLSLRDMAYAFRGTEKNFDVKVSSSEISITTGADYASSGTGDGSFDQATTDAVYGLSYTLKVNDIKIDGQQVKYYSLIGSYNGVNDAYISTTDFALIFDVDIWLRDGNLYADTTKEYMIDIEKLDESEYFAVASGVLVGDATTGEIYYEYEGDQSLAIASTTKLMTYLVLMDEVAKGHVSMKDGVVISSKAQWLSGTNDAVVRLTAGSVVSMEDLLYAMLVASSNECSLAIAEHVAGSEDAFVEMMNATAKTIGLSENAKFYNCNGLPVYSDDIITAKNQNHMTCQDMFILCRNIIGKYPQLFDITSSKKRALSTLGIEVTNKNALIYNMPQCVGLKTGTTNKAGACLVSAAKLDIEGKEHVIVAVEFGAENAIYRYTASQVLLTYGIQAANGLEPVLHENMTAKDEIQIPTTAEGLCYMIVNAARNRE